MLYTMRQNAPRGVLSLNRKCCVSLSNSWLNQGQGHQNTKTIELFFFLQLARGHKQLLRRQAGAARQHQHPSEPQDFRLQAGSA